MPVIIEALQPFIHKSMRNGLEIASGTGQHILECAKSFRHVVWQPTEVDPAAFMSIDAYRQSIDNILPPLVVDASVDDTWKCLASQSFDLVLNINMIHISPYEATTGLFRNAARVLQPNGLLCLYGPMRRDGELKPESNVVFDQQLRLQNPKWGIRDLDQLSLVAQFVGFKAQNIVIDMPCNNHLVIFSLNR